MVLSAIPIDLIVTTLPLLLRISHSHVGRLVLVKKNHVVCLKSEQDLFQSASLPRTRRKRIVGADL